MKHIHLLLPALLILTVPAFAQTDHATPSGGVEIGDGAAGPTGQTLNAESLKKSLPIIRQDMCTKAMHSLPKLIQENSAWLRKKAADNQQSNMRLVDDICRTTLHKETMVDETVRNRMCNGAVATPAFKKLVGSGVQSADLLAMGRGLNHLLGVKTERAHVLSLMNTFLSYDSTYIPSEAEVADTEQQLNKLLSDLCDTKTALSMAANRSLYDRAFNMSFDSSYSRTTIKFTRQLAIDLIEQVLTPIHLVDFTEHTKDFK